MQKITNYLTNIFCNKDENEDENKISKELKAEVLKTFHSDPFEEEYEDKNMVYKYIKFIMTIKDKCPNIIHITQLQEFREFRKENPIIFCDSKKLDKKILGNRYGGSKWTSDYYYPSGVGIFTFN